VAFGTAFEVTGGFRKAETSFLKGVLGGYLQFVTIFIDTNFVLVFLHKNRIFENPQCSYDKFCFVF
jgi:hypothetical protein